MKKRSLFLLFLLSMFAIVFLNGCISDRIRYRVKIIENYEFVDGFLENHQISECYYYDSLTNQYVMNDPTLPEEYTFIIRSEKEYNEIFKTKSDVNFNKEILVVYIYSSVYSSKKMLTEVDFDEGELSIEFRHKLLSGTGSATMPLQKYVVFKMNNGNFYEIDVDED